MTNILIVGANGQIARVATQMLLARTDADLVLYLRRAVRLDALRSNPRVRIIEGDASDTAALTAAMSGQDIIYANLSDNMEQHAKSIVSSMGKTGVRRLIFISSMGIYSEIHGEAYRRILDPYRDSAAIIEASGLDYTIIRPAWLNDDEEIAYDLTSKGEAFLNAGQVVSRASVADLIVRLVTDQSFGVGASFGVHHASNKQKRDKR